MSFLLPLFAGLGTMALGKLTAPKAPKSTAFTPVDLQAETTKIFNENEAMKPAAARDTANAAWTNALSLSRGELPEDVQKMVRQSAAESAASIGLSGDQATRLTARNLGLSSLDAMQTGQRLAAQLETLRDNDWATAQNSAVSKANQLFEAWSTAEQAKMNRYALKLQQHNQLFSGLTTLATGAATAYAANEAAVAERQNTQAFIKQQAAEGRQFSLMLSEKYANSPALANIPASMTLSPTPSYFMPTSSQMARPFTS